MTGETVPKYRILERIGEGGMGVVCKAEDTTLRRIVAVKFCDLAPVLWGSIASYEKLLRLWVSADGDLVTLRDAKHRLAALKSSATQ
jgi:serine/threonine protein kinase